MRSASWATTSGTLLRPQLRLANINAAAGWCRVYKLAEEEVQELLLPTLRTHHSSAPPHLLHIRD